jgi:Methane oxygenase PmoA
MKRWFAVLVMSAAIANAARAQENALKIDVPLDKNLPMNSPLTIPLSVTKAQAAYSEIAVDVITGRDVATAVGQLTAPSIITESIKPARDGLVRRDLHVVLTTPCRSMVAHFAGTKPQVTRFAWTEKAGEYQELILTRSGTSTPYLRYMNHTYDTSSKAARDTSYKVFHHLYDPIGKRLVTNGGFADDKNADPKKLLYPHHRGIMYGFNKCSYGPDLKKKADTWHCTGDAHVAHLESVRAEAGPVLGRHRVRLGWFGEKNDRFADEERELTVYHVKGGTLVEFASRLKTTGGKVRVDGDPQHAGFQFRAANDVAAAANKKLTFYLHPDGIKGEMGKE